MHVTHRFNDAQVQRAFKVLGARALSAVSRALNRSAVTTKTVMQRNVADDTKLPSRTVAKQLRIEEARPSPERLRARIIITGARIPLADFKARQTRRGVTADVGTGRKLYPSTFLAKMKSGHEGVFGRRGKARLPIDERFGPSLPHVFEKHISEGLARGEESMQKNLAHELSYALSQSSK